MTRVARGSLAGAFAPAAPDAASPTDRSSALAGLLPARTVPTEPRPPQGGVRAPGAAVSSAAGAGATSSARPSPRVREQAPRSPAPAIQDLDRVRNVAFYVSPELLDRLRRTARSRELTYAELLIEAAGAHLDDVAGTFGRPQKVVEDGMMPNRPTRARNEPAVQRQMRLDGHQVAWLEEQASRLAAPSRNALVAALLQAHLGPADPRREH